MKTPAKIRQALKKANQLEKAIKEIVREIEDYDLERLLKKVDAECLDVQHNLVLAERLSKAQDHKKTKRNTQGKSQKD
jgi:hypothetical protein